MRLALALWMGTMAAACVNPRQAQPPDPSSYPPDPAPPACISRALEARYGACPLRAAVAPARAACVPGPLPSETEPAGACADQAAVVRAEQAAGHERAVVRELNRLLDGGCGPESARLLLELGDDWLLRGAPQGSQPADPHALDLAEQAYRRILASFSQAELDSWGICASVGELRHARAELLLLLRRWDECALAFDEALPGAPSEERARSAALGAVQCHQQGWIAWRDRLATAPMLARVEAQLEHNARRKGLLLAFHRYLCVSHGRDANLAWEVAMSRAETFSEAGAFLEAAVGYRSLAFDTRRAESLVAAQRYAELLEGMSADEDCRRDLVRDLERLHALHCSRPRAARTACRELGARVERAGGIATRVR